MIQRSQTIFFICSCSDIKYLKDTTPLNIKTALKIIYILVEIL